MTLPCALHATSHSDTERWRRKPRTSSELLASQSTTRLAAQAARASPPLHSAATALHLVPFPSHRHPPVPPCSDPVDLALDLVARRTGNSPAAPRDNAPPFPPTPHLHLPNTRTHSIARQSAAWSAAAAAAAERARIMRSSWSKHLQPGFEASTLSGCAPRVRLVRQEKGKASRPRQR